ncbi:hypothetical protein F4780DRAFT_173372 [Xylariomycetidae sp. FL0641]|nr:hypothetical protein F4780DRAFT_173372 [Xylariomycetidae sp. FL0641]
MHPSNPPFLRHPEAGRRGSNPPFLRHPEAGRREEPRAPSQGIPSVRPKMPEGLTKAPTLAASTPINPGVFAEMKLSLAAKQLAEQLKESQVFWQAFREDYEKEVQSVKPYADEAILERIWQKKVSHRGKRQGEEQAKFDQWTIQRMKVEACLGHVDEATKLLNATASSNDTAGHDPRRHHLENIQGTGSRVLGLAKKSMSGEAAYSDLMIEVLQLEKLVDPRSYAAMLHRFDTYEAENAAGGDGGGSETTSAEEESSPAQSSTEKVGSESDSGNTCVWS